MALGERSTGPAGRAGGDREVGRQEAEAVLATRAELGPAYDAALVDSFAERVERAVEARVEEQTRRLQRADDAAEAAGKRQLALGIVSLGCGIPITAISAGIAGLPGLAVAWGGIALVNLAHALAGRRG